MGLIEDATEKELRGRLLIKGMTLEGFAVKHGFNSATVRRVMCRHVGKSKVRRGAKTKLILARLEEEITQRGARD